MHYLITVIVPEINVSNLHAYVNRVLEPYSENKQVPKYLEKCGCVGELAEREAREYANNEFGTFDEYREKYNKMCVTDGRTVEDVEKQNSEFYSEFYSQIIPDDIQAIIDSNNKMTHQVWVDGLKDRFEAEEKFLDAHPEKDRPNPFCGCYSGERKDWWPDDVQEGDRDEEESSCGGTGYIESTSNPHGYLDWWCIGGRWNGLLAPEGKKPENNPDNWESCFLCHGTGMRNDTLGQEIREKNPRYTCNGCSGKGQVLKFASSQIDSGFNIVSPTYMMETSKSPPYGFVDIDGSWHSRETYGSKHKDLPVEDWEKIWKSKIERLSDETRLVLVDIHT